MSDRHESFRCNLVELVADSSNEERNQLRKLVGESFEVMSTEKETEEGDDFDLESSSSSRKTVVGNFEGSFDFWYKSGSLRIKPSVEDSNELMNEPETGLSSRKRFGSELLDDRFGDGRSLCS